MNSSVFMWMFRAEYYFQEQKQKNFPLTINVRHETSVHSVYYTPDSRLCT